MSTARTIVHATLLALLAACVACSESPTAPASTALSATHPNIHRIDLGTLGGDESFAYAINDAGVVVGSSDINGSESHAFRWTKANGMQDLGAGIATRINTAGYAVGIIVGTDGWTVPVWNPDGSVLATISRSGFELMPAGISDAGVVAGKAFPVSGGENSFFTWTAAGGIVLLELGPGVYSLGPMNHNGDLAGAKFVGTDDSPTWFSVTGTTVQLLPQHGIPQAINDLKQMVGFDADENIVAYSPPGSPPLGPFGATAYGLNNSGVVVGDYWWNQKGRPVLRDHHAYMSSASAGFVDLGAGTAYAVNADGTIAGISYAINPKTQHADSRAAVWTVR